MNSSFNDRSLIKATSRSRSWFCIRHQHLIASTNQSVHQLINNSDIFWVGTNQRLHGHTSTADTKVEVCSNHGQSRIKRSLIRHKHNSMAFHRSACNKKKGWFVQHPQTSMSYPTSTTVSARAPRAVTRYRSQLSNARKSLLTFAFYVMLMVVVVIIGIPSG